MRGIGEFLPERSSGKKTSDVQTIVNEYLRVQKIAGLPRQFYKENNISYPRLARSAKELLFLTAGNVSTAVQMLNEFSSKMKDYNLTWTIDTLNRWIREEKFW